MGTCATAPDPAQVFLCCSWRPRGKVWLAIHRQRPVDAKLLQVPLDLLINMALDKVWHCAFCEGCNASQQASLCMHVVPMASRTPLGPLPHL